MTEEIFFRVKSENQFDQRQMFGFVLIDYCPVYCSNQYHPGCHNCVKHPVANVTLLRGRIHSPHPSPFVLTPPVFICTLIFSDCE